jgi:hypothetical protein
MTTTTAISTLFVTQLVERICANVGLDDTYPSDDRTQAVFALNDAYSEIASGTGCIKRGIALSTNGDVDLNLTEWTHYTGVDHSADDADFPTILDVDGVGVVSGANTSPLMRASYLGVVSNRSTASTGNPSRYCYHGGTLSLDASAADTSLVLFCSIDAPIIYDGISTGNSFIGLPNVWVMRLLVPLATAMILEGYEGDEQRAAGFRARFDHQMALFNLHRAREGGLSLNGYPLQDFTTPGVVKDR